MAFRGKKCFKTERAGSGTLFANKRANENRKGSGKPKVPVRNAMAEEQDIEKKAGEEAAAAAESAGEAAESPAAAKVEDSAEWKELHDKYLRLHAEFENYRRRTARESLEQARRGEFKVLGSLLGVVDDFDRAIEGGEGQEAQAFFAGMKMIHDRFNRLLADFGLKTVGAVGDKFDPELHEALMKQPSDSVEEDRIVAVFEKGYAAGDRILRHAKVVVSAGKSEEENNNSKE